MTVTVSKELSTANVRDSKGLGYGFMRSCVVARAALKRNSTYIKPLVFHDSLMPACRSVEEASKLNGRSTRYEEL